MGLKDQTGIAIDWDTITPDGSRARADLSGLPAGAKRAMIKSRLGNILNTMLPSDPTAADIDQLNAVLEEVGKSLDEMTDEEIAEIFATQHGESADFHL